MYNLDMAYFLISELPLPCGTVVPMEVASNSRDSYPFLTKRLAVRTNQGIFTYAAIPLTGILLGFSSWNPYTFGLVRKEKSVVRSQISGTAFLMMFAAA